MLYWIPTVLISLMLAASALSYLFHENTIIGVRELGFPDFFRVELAVLKFLAIPALLLPKIPIQMKEWAYAGVGLYLITAIIAHAAHKDPIILNIINIVFVALLLTSYIHLPRQ